MAECELSMGSASRVSLIKTCAQYAVVNAACCFAVPARPDDECIKILKAVRGSVGSNAAATGRSSSRNVRLLIVEVTTTEDVLPCHLAVR